MVNSKKYDLNKEDMIKVGKGGLIAVAGVILTYAIDLIPMIDWGKYELPAMIVMMMFVNLSQKLVQGKQKII